VEIIIICLRGLINNRKKFKQMIIISNKTILVIMTVSIIISALRLKTIILRAARRVILDLKQVFKTMTHNEMQKGILTNASRHQMEYTTEWSTKPLKITKQLQIHFVVYSIL
jgi:hypothetical protein